MNNEARQREHATGFEGDERKEGCILVILYEEFRHFREGLCNLLRVLPRDKGGDCKQARGHSKIEGYPCEFAALARNTHRHKGGDKERPEKREMIQDQVGMGRVHAQAPWFAN